MPAGMMLDPTLMITTEDAESADKTIIRPDNGISRINRSLKISSHFWGELVE